MTNNETVEFLASKRRVLVIGGMAVIMHGLARGTKDSDIWMDPMPDVRSWLAPLVTLVREHGLQLRRIGDRTGEFEAITLDELPAVAERDGMVRIATTDRPVDAFYRPTNFDLEDFEPAWNRALQLDDGTKLVDAIDLVLTKYDTGRDHDQADILFLRGKIEAQYQKKLRVCSAEEAAELFDRFLTPEIAAFAARYAQDEAVRQAGSDELMKMVAEGDPYARDLVQELSRAHIVRP